MLGRVNAWFAPRVDIVACGTWPTALPKGVEGVHTGNPVRAAVRDKAGASYMIPGANPMSVLVIGGSQGARVLSDMVPAAIAALPEPLRGRVRVSHQARPEDHDRVAAAYAAAGIDAEVQPFFTDLPRADERGGTGDQPLGRLVRRRYRGDRAAGDPDPLCGGDRRSPDRQRPRPG